MRLYSPISGLLSNTNRRVSAVLSVLFLSGSLAAATAYAAQHTHPKNKHTITHKSTPSRHTWESTRTKHHVPMRTSRHRVLMRTSRHRVLRHEKHAPTHRHPVAVRYKRHHVYRHLHRVRIVHRRGRHRRLTARELARTAQLHHAFVASEQLRPMAQQLDNYRSPAAYAGVTAYARDHKGSAAAAAAKSS